jgi:hypothetical protein
VFGVRYSKKANKKDQKIIKAIYDKNCSAKLKANANGVNYYY